MTPAQQILATAAFQAYNAMETTKKRHLDLMLAIDKRGKKFNLTATEAEVDMLNRLLKDHDAQVEQFKLESDTLKSVNPEAHLAMFKYVGEIHNMLDAFVQEEPGH
jgi:wobble nucleotide-excising tRNase